MKPAISPLSYYSPEIFDLEKQWIFSSTWYFVGIESEVSKHEDFLTSDIAGKSVVIQNFDGELKAFHNVCSHRFSKIQNEACGNRRFQCPYHGWIYNRDGKPYAIPKKPKFPEMNEKLMCDMSLTQFHLEKCGQLLFVRISPEGLSLREYLGDLFEELAILSRGVGSRIDRNILTIKANWKICVENTLESYHVGFVHTETFKKLGIVDAGFSFTGAHSTWEGTVDEALARKFEKLQQIYGRRPYKIPGYKHFLLFPATTIGTTYGSSFAFQDFHPVSQNETVFTSHVFGCRLDSLSAGQQIMVEMMNKSIVEFNRSVFEEDRVIVEYVQVGSEQTSEQSGILSDEEERVCAFQKAYLAQMAKGNVDNLVIA